MQRRSLPLGQIRIGDSEPVAGKSYRKPRRLQKFRFTTPVRETADAIAAKFGGIPAPWDRRPGYWAVDTDQSVIEVWVPPRGLAVDAWMELWDGGRCKRRCDGITEQRSGQPCMCPQPQDRTDAADVARAANERKRLAALNPPQGCKPTTRISVQIPGLPGVTGVWQLRTGSANAAVETADTGEVLERAREMDVYLPALLVIDWRPGQDGHPYPVLTLRLRPSAEQVAELPAGMDGMLAMLSAGSGPLALTAGQPATGPPAATGLPPAEFEHAGPEHAAADVPAPQGMGEPVSGQAPDLARAAQDIAKRIPGTRTRADVEALAAEAGRLRVLDYIVSVTENGHTADEELRAALDARWRELPAPSRGRAGCQQAPAQPRKAASGGTLWPEGLPPEPPEDWL